MSEFGIMNKELGIVQRQAIDELRDAGIDSAELDVSILLCKVLKKDKTFLLTHPNDQLTNSQFNHFTKLINRRLKNEPVAYITGHKEFYGTDFLVNKNVLIPRPESEMLVELALQRIKNFELRIKNNPKIHNSKFNILDLGTGSGCLAISIALAAMELGIRNYELGIFASDISRKALNVAKKNADRLLPRPVISTHFESTVGWAEKGEKSQRFEKNITIKFIHSDLFSNPKLHTKYDLIIANLPYVPDCHFDSPIFQSGAEKSSENQKISRLANAARDDKLNSISFEPSTAIFAPDNGTSVIKKFLHEVHPFLQQTSLLLLEVDPRNAKELLNYSKNIFPNAKIELKKDLAGLDRCLIIEN